MPQKIIEIKRCEDINDWYGGQDFFKEKIFTRIGNLFDFKATCLTSPNIYLILTSIFDLLRVSGQGDFCQVSRNVLLNVLLRLNLLRFENNTTWFKKNFEDVKSQNNHLLNFSCIWIIILETLDPFIIIFPRLYKTKK